MTVSGSTQGHGMIETDAGEKIPVYYSLLVEREHADDGSSGVRMSGRLSISNDPWLETTVIKEGHILILQDGHRLRVRVSTGGRSAETLPFRAAPLDD